MDFRFGTLIHCNYFCYAFVRINVRPKLSVGNPCRSCAKPFLVFVVGIFCEFYSAIHWKNNFSRRQHDQILAVPAGRLSGFRRTTPTDRCSFGRIEFKKAKMEN